MLSLFTLFGCIPAQDTEKNPPPEEEIEEEIPAEENTTENDSSEVVFFGNTDRNPNTDDCGLVYQTYREIEGNSLQIITENTVQELLKGPTEAEQENGFTSFFNEVTANDLNRIEIDEASNAVYVDLKSEMKTEIPNATSSCGSAQFLASLDNTLEALGFTRVYYNFDGNPVEFYSWLQLSCPVEICE